ncbi:MAG: 30S ribosomal protein S7 [Candidatus Magasanikbacteria bacterium RIFCSPHIGHO2_02_FULL_51_14]|uniref:Small ribosomal subunit protein uS7 n=1 Tax=Candidatus Magasanikbacteria bacterium RIFCSPHIGHO2_02_FULL_51_14 TaxID=1798683 RepID=A0A1F6MH82_9BACT|nr:MAG: 30S ribosomal protein S7 [Candidatus Magasanikbacteria bacterium RIFCSPHIGHO2_02_FULL_51_14]
MSRGKQAPKRKILPDPKYKSELVAKFINFIMERGKKTLAQSIVYGAFAIVEKKKETDPLKVFEQAIGNVRPQVEVRSRRVGGANYQIPLPVAGTRQNALAFRWIIGAAQARKGQPMFQKLAAEFLDAADGTGGAMKKKEDVHRMAEANKAFAHFARFGAKKK